VTGLATGEGEFSNNDTVLVVGEGVWSDEVVVSKNSVVKVAGLSHEELAVLPAFAAAWGLLHNFVALKAGDVVVQTYGNSAIGSAVTQVGKAMGLKVVSLADSDVKGTNVAAKLQEAGAFKLALSGKSGKHLSSLQRHVARGGTTVVYNGVFEPLQSAADVQLPISHMIFSDSSVHGFDLQAWARAAPGEFKAALSSLSALAQDKKIALKAAHTFPQAEYLKAVEEVTQTGAAVVLKH
jgi:NADPH:quinone reductase-like Zn-dependent oxidoreductase